MGIKEEGMGTYPPTFRRNQTLRRRTLFFGTCRHPTWPHFMFALGCSESQPMRATPILYIMEETAQGSQSLVICVHWEGT